MDDHDTKTDSGSFQTFMSETTAHGFRNILGLGRSKFIRFLWLMCVLGMGTSLTTILYFMLLDYQNYPFNTVVNIKPITKLDFPTVTICDISFLNSSNFRNPDAVADTFANEGPLKHLVDLNENDPEYTNVSRLPMDKAFEKSNISVSDMFRLCIWNYENIPCDTLWTPVYTDMGRCFVFNQNMSERFAVQTAGSKSGLSVIAQVIQNGYVSSDSLAAGLKLHLHEPHESPDMSKYGILAAPGTTSLIAVQKKSYTFLGSPYKAYGDEHCVLDDFRKPNSTTPYNREICIRSCLAAIVIRNCSCKFVTDLDITEYPFCTIHEWLRCYRPTLDKLYTQDLSRTECYCPRTCRYNKYNTRLSTGMFPSARSIQLLAKLGVVSDKKEARLGYIDINIFYEDLLEEEVSHVPVYSFAMIMGTIGGQMGLFLGASFITLAEVLEMFIRLLYSVTVKVCYRHISEKPSHIKSNKIRVMST